MLTEKVIWSLLTLLKHVLVGRSFNRFFKVTTCFRTITSYEHFWLLFSFETASEVDLSVKRFCWVCVMWSDWRESRSALQWWDNCAVYIPMSLWDGHIIHTISANSVFNHELSADAVFIGVVETVTFHFSAHKDLIAALNNKLSSSKHTCPSSKTICVWVEELDWLLIWWWFSWVLT